MSGKDELSLEDRLKISQLYEQVALKILGELETLHRDELYLTLANRAYYAVLNMSKALLILFGEEPSTHRGVRQRLHLRFADHKDMLAIFDELWDVREKADYDVFFVARGEMDEEKARKLWEKAEKFVSEARRLKSDIVKELSPSLSPSDPGRWQR